VHRLSRRNDSTRFWRRSIWHPKTGLFFRRSEKLLGTGGAIKRALPLLGGEFFVLYGDSYLPVDYAPIADFFRRSGKLG
jgi:NDP-sugar pyrophosphorylase family protein